MVLRSHPANERGQEWPKIIPLSLHQTQTKGGYCSAVAIVLRIYILSLFSSRGFTKVKRPAGAVGREDRGRSLFLAAVAGTVGTHPPFGAVGC